MDELDAAVQLPSGSTVNLHVYVVEADPDHVEFKVKDSTNYKRGYTVRDSSNQATIIDVVTETSDAPALASGFYYMKKIKVFNKALTAWPNAMISASDNDVFEIEETFTLLS